MPMLRTLNQDFFKKWRPDMAYVLGFFAADGSMLLNSRGAHFIEFTITDRVVLEYIQRVVGSNHRIAERKARNKNWKTQYRLQIGSRVWFSDLSDLGFTQHKSNTLRFPFLPGTMQGHFIRGYFDGDGCVHFNSYWSKQRNKHVWVFSTLFTSGSKVFLEELHALLKKHGVKGGRIGEKKRGFELVLSRHDSLALHSFMYNNGSITGFWLPRKRIVFDAALKTLYGSTARS